MRFYYVTLLVAATLFSTSNALSKPEANQLSKVDTAAAEGQIDTPKRFLRGARDSVDDEDEERGATACVKQFVQKLKTKAIRTKTLANVDEAVSLKQMQQWYREGKKPSHFDKLSPKRKLFNSIRKAQDVFRPPDNYDNTQIIGCVDAERWNSANNNAASAILYSFCVPKYYTRALKETSMVANVQDSSLSVHDKADDRQILGILRKIIFSRRVTEVVPVGPPPQRGSLSDIKFLAIWSKSPDDNSLKVTFHEAFGILGLPMVIMVLGCITWTCWLLSLSIDPNAAVNFLMNTNELDDGQFWLIPDERNTLKAFSVAGLVVVLLFYFYVLVKMLVWRSKKNAIENRFDKLLGCWRAAAQQQANSSLKSSIYHWISEVSWDAYFRWKTLTGINGKNRKIWNIFLKVHDLIMLSLMLRDILEAGMPVPIVYGLSALAAANSLSCAFGIVFSRFSAIVEILVDSFFDFSATVVYPLTVFYYCTKNFHYDRAVLFINLEILPNGSFERRARMYANPAEIALVRSTFDSLRILDPTDFILRIAMSLGFSYRCKRIVEVLIEKKVWIKHDFRTRSNSLLQPSPRTASTEQLLAIQKSIPRPIAIFFILYGVGILFVTHKSITSSQAVCSQHKACVVFAYRWYNSEFCPCRAIVDGNPAPMTYYEWTHPVDAAKTVSYLAAAGTLETLQLINQQLTILPDELRGCYNLNLISLINCATETLPAWLKEFDKLQYLQIEGKVGSENLGNLAPDLFDNMAELRYFQLGVHPRMTHLPSLLGAPKLRSIMLSRLYNLVEFPSLGQQNQVERLELTSCKSLSSLPDLQWTTGLDQFIIFQGANLCCNGFLGICDLTNPYCLNATCLNDSKQKATPATLQAFHKFSDSLCQPYSQLSQVPTPETIQMCDGGPYRQCRFPLLESNSSVIGMCWNHRMQVLACNPDPDKIRVRRRQLEDGVGAECDPLEEAWLGCLKQ